MSQFNPVITTRCHPFQIRVLFKLYFESTQRTVIVTLFRPSSGNNLGLVGYLQGYLQGDLQTDQKYELVSWLIKKESKRTHGIKIDKAN